MVKRVSFCGLLLALSALAAVLVFGQATTNIIPPMGTGPTAPSTCTAPALFFQTPAGTPMYCSAGVFVSFGSSTGAAITGSPVSGNLAVFSAANSITNGNVSGDCTTSGSAVITCTKTSGTAYATSATTDTTNASNIASGNLALARLPAVLNSPVSGGLLGATGASTYAWTAALTAGLPIIGQGAGAVPIVGAKTGSTNTFATASGSLTPGNVPKFDASGNIIDSGNLPGTAGTYPVVNVVNDSPGIGIASSNCTIILTQGSLNATASSGTCFSTSNIGSILQYNSGTAPNFRAVIVAVNGSTVSLNTIFPAPTTSALNFNASLTSGTWNTISDPMAQVQASLFNHVGSTLDARGISGNVTSSYDPFTVSASTPGGEIYFGSNVQITTSRPWYEPGVFRIAGPGGWSGAIGSFNVNPLLLLDSTNWPGAVDAVNGAVSTSVTTSLKGTLWTDTGAGTGGSNAGVFQVGAQGANTGSFACSTSPSGYGYFQLGANLNGLVEGETMTLQGVTGATVWNGNWTVTGILGGSPGPYVAVYFGGVSGTTCTVASIGGTPLFDTASGDTLQATWCQAGNPGTGCANVSAGTLSIANAAGTGGQTGNNIYTITDTASDFAASDIGACYLSCLTGSCATNQKIFTMAYFNSATSTDVSVGAQTPASGAWATTWKKICSVTSVVKSTTSATVLNTANPMQYAIANGTSTTYTISPAVLNGQQHGSSNSSVPGTQIVGFNVNCNSGAASTGILFQAPQEQSTVAQSKVQACTAYAFDRESGAGHAGMYQDIQGYANPTGATPQTACYFSGQVNSGGGNYGFNGFTCIGQGPGSSNPMPFAAFVIEGPTILMENWHTETVNDSVQIQYGSSPGSIMSLNGNPGVSQYADFFISSDVDRKEGINLLNTWTTNGPANAVVIDQTQGPVCGSNGVTTPTYASGQGGPGVPRLEHYEIGESPTATRYRITNDTNVNNCLTSTTTMPSISTFTNCAGGGAAGSATPTCNGVAGTITVPASTTSVTVADTSVTANSNITITQVTNTTRTGATSCSGTAATPLVSAQTAGTSWVFTLTSVAAETCFEFQFVN